jgi:hypothetical protein
MSIYATLWALQFPRFGEFHIGCEWVTVIAQGVPAHVGAGAPDPCTSFLPTLPNSVAVGLRAVVFVVEGTASAHDSTRHLFSTSWFLSEIFCRRTANAAPEDESDDNIPVLFRGRQLLDLLSYADIVEFIDEKLNCVSHYLTPRATRVRASDEPENTLKIASVEELLASIPATEPLTLPE